MEELLMEEPRLPGCQLLGDEGARLLGCLRDARLAGQDLGEHVLSGFGDASTAAHEGVTGVTRPFAAALASALRTGSLERTPAKVVEFGMAPFSLASRSWYFSPVSSLM